MARARTRRKDEELLRQMRRTKTLPVSRRRKALRKLMGVSEELGEPSDIYERYADDIYKEAARGERPFMDPAVQKALEIRPPAWLLDQRLENPPGGTVTTPDGETVPVNFYLRQRRRQRAQEKANRTNKPVRLPGRGGNEIAEWVSPQKPKQSQEIPGTETPVTQQTFDEYDKAASPHREQLLRLNTELKQVEQQIGELQDRDRLDENQQAELARLKTRQSELRTEQERTKVGLDKVRSDFAKRAAEEDKRIREAEPGKFGHFKKISPLSPGSVKGTKWDPALQQEAPDADEVFNRIAREFETTGSPVTAAQMLRMRPNMNVRGRRRLIEATTPQAWDRWERRQTAKGRYLIAVQDAKRRAREERDHLAAANVIRASQRTATT